MTSSTDSKIIIIGAGVAGLSTGIFAQKNGYSSQIFEMHTLPGGLMTAWKRKGYTIDGCIHWLTGSSQNSGYYKLWQEIGILQPDSQVINPDTFTMFEASDGTKVYWYCNIDRLEKHLLKLAPADTKLIRTICRSARKLVGFDQVADLSLSMLEQITRNIKAFPKMVSAMPEMVKWGKLSMADFARLFKTPALREMFAEMWMDEMTAAVVIFLMAYLNDSNAGYPIGGSMPMAVGQEKKYLELGGEIHYGSKVEKILVENGQAIGVRLADGREFRADDVISAADGHATIYDMLDGKYVDEKINSIYSNTKPFPAIILAGFGVNRKFDDLPALHGGVSIRLNEPIQIADETLTRIDCMVYNFDPTLAPEGKTVLTVTIPTNYTYWKELSAEPEKYKAEKERIGIELIRNLDQRFPGLEGQVEMADVATPMTFERYTGNWQASFEGFLPTPKTVMMQIPKTLPGLEHFYMVGQWVQAGGGLPSGLLTGQEIIARICKRDKKKFV